MHAQLVDSIAVAFRLQIPVPKKVSSAQMSTCFVLHKPPVNRSQTMACGALIFWYNNYRSRARLFSQQQQTCVNRFLKHELPAHCMKLSFKVCETLCNACYAKARGSSHKPYSTIPPVRTAGVPLLQNQYDSVSDCMIKQRACSANDTRVYDAQIQPREYG